MNPWRFVLCAAAAASLGGCASVSFSPQAATVRLEPVPSAAVAIYQPKLIAKDGQTVLDGWVYRQFGAQTTTQSHLDVVFFDAGGGVLRLESTHFAPRDLRRGSHKMAHRGHYMVPLSHMPSGTASIQVRAHDTAEHQP